MSYQHERDEFITRMAREGLPLDVTLRLLREATGLQRRAELACSSEAADRDRVPCPASRNKAKAIKGALPCLCDHYNGDGAPHGDVTRIAVQDWRAEGRIRLALQRVNDDILQSGAPINVQNPALWTMQTEGDPRGYTLRVIPPSYAERNAGKDRHNLDAIGVPSGPTGLRF